MCLSVAVRHPNHVIRCLRPTLKSPKQLWNFWTSVVGNHKNIANRRGSIAPKLVIGCRVRRTNIQTHQEFGITLSTLDWRVHHASDRAAQ